MTRIRLDVLVLASLVITTLGCATATTTAPTTASTSSICTCYYSYDEECPKGFVCDQDWNPIACVRMKPKGGAYAGKCTEKDEQKLVRPCDATCSEKKTGKSPCAGESTTNVARSFELWRQAITNPALRGGGPIDADLAQQARALLNRPCAEYVAWRTLAVLELCRGHAITDHSDPDHDELTEHVMADLSGDECRVTAGNVCIATIIAGLTQGPGVVESQLQSIQGACRERLPFASAGPGYERTPPMDAVADRLRVTIEYLSGTRR